MPPDRARNSRRPWRRAPYSLASLTLLAVGLAASAPAAAQEASAAPATARRSRQEAAIRPDVERYLRVLQLAGLTPAHAWGIRGFAPADLDSRWPTDSAHPWRARFDSAPARPGARFLGAEVAGLFAATRPPDAETGPVWAGRGLTTTLSVAGTWRRGPLSVTLAPVLWRTENRSFPLRATGPRGTSPFENDLDPHDVDAPQRFGSAPLTELAPGESAVRVDGRGLELGLSTAAELWGPAVEHALVLGRNAGGFPHLFAGFVLPARAIRIGTFRFRQIVGRLDQSDWSPIAPDSSRRLASGVVASFVPAFAPNVEIGATRFFHRFWPSEGLGARDLLIPYEAVFKQRLLARKDSVGAQPDNQLASVFVRAALPASRTELYGEYVREDHALDRRDLLLEPDQNAGYLLGMQTVVRHAATRLIALRAEIVNGRTTHLSRVRGQNRLYVHNVIRQGHTEGGKLLASPAAFAGGGSTVALDWYGTDGALEIAWDRQQRSPIDESALETTEARDQLRARLVRLRGPYELSGTAALGIRLIGQPRDEVITPWLQLGVRRFAWW